MIAINNEGWLNVCRNCECAGFLPKLFYELQTGKPYTTATVSFVGGGGSGATGTAVVQDGKIVSIVVNTPGDNYTSEPEVVIEGDGEGAKAIAVLSDTPGDTVDSVIILHPGGNNMVVKDQSSFDSGDDLAIVNVWVTDKNGGEVFGNIDTASDSISIDLDGLDINGGVDIRATVVTEDKCTANLAKYNIHAYTQLSGTMIK